MMDVAMSKEAFYFNEQQREQKAKTYKNIKRRERKGREGSKQINELTPEAKAGKRVTASKAGKWDELRSESGAYQQSRLKHVRTAS